MVIVSMMVVFQIHVNAKCDSYRQDVIYTAFIVDNNHEELYTPAYI